MKRENRFGKLRLLQGLYLLFIAFLSSCQAEIEIESPISTTTAVEFSTPPSTRLTSTSFENGDKIGVFAIKKGTPLPSSGNYGRNKCYVYQDGMFSALDNSHKIYENPEEEYDYYAYYPYYNRGGNPLNICYKAGATSIDHLTGRGISNGTHHVILTFKHIYSCVEVTIYKSNSDIIESGVILNKEGDQYTNLYTGKITSSGSVYDEINMRFIFEVGSAYIYQVYIPRQDIKAGTDLFRFQTRSGKSLTYTALKSLSLVEGQRHSFFINNAKNFTIIASATPGGSITKGSAGFLIGKTFYENQTCDIPFAPQPMGSDPFDTYHFQGIYENGIRQSCESSPYTFTVSSNRNLEVRFSKDIPTYNFQHSDGSTSFNKFLTNSFAGTFNYSFTSNKIIIIDGITYTKELPFSFSSDSNWVTVTGGTVSFSANPTTAPRTAIITFTQMESGKTLTIKVIQIGKNSVDIN